MAGCDAWSAVPQSQVHEMPIERPTTVRLSHVGAGAGTIYRSFNTWAVNSTRFWRNMRARKPSTTTEAGVANFTRLELFCRLFLGLFVGFFCITAALFVRYMSANPLPEVAVVQSKSASQTLSGSAPAASSSSASRSRPATPSPDTREMTLIASSTSTLVTFIAAAVAHLLSGGKGKRAGRPTKGGRPVASLEPGKDEGGHGKADRRGRLR